MGTNAVDFDIANLIDTLDEAEINARDAYHLQTDEWKDSEPGRRVLKGLHELRQAVLTLQYPDE